MGWKLEDDEGVTSNTAPSASSLIATTGCTVVELSAAFSSATSADITHVTRTGRRVSEVGGGRWLSEEAKRVQGSYRVRSERDQAVAVNIAESMLR